LRGVLYRIATVVAITRAVGGQELDATPSPHFSGERDGVRGKKIKNMKKINLF